ncbi:MAG: hypothetical protein R3257_02565, partial [bacterium]|nr:hypothetical protein [bacterium]
MSSPTKPFSGGAFEFFRDHQDNSFTQAPEDIYPESQLGRQFTAQGAGTQVRYHPGLGFEISLITGIDDDSDIQNGRLLQKDIFLLNPEGETKHITRQFHFDKKTPEASYWEARAKSFSENFKAKPEKISLFQDFISQTVFKKPGMAFHQLDDSFFQGFAALSDESANFLRAPGNELQEQTENIGQSFKNEKSGYYVLNYGTHLEVILRVSLADADKKPHAFVQHRFYLDSQSKEMLGYERDWAAAEGYEKDVPLNGILKKLNANPLPEQNVAQEFIAGMVPHLNFKVDAAPASKSDNLLDQVTLP